MRGWWILPATIAAAACSSDRTTGPNAVPPPVPTSLVSTSLDGAVALTWDDNAFQANPNNFQNYRIYSTSFDIDAGLCGTSWRLEGSTVAPEFVVGALANGVPQCFAVSSVSAGQAESGRSAPRNDTPRPDARNVVVFARQVQDAGSGFRFWDDLNGDRQVQRSELGIVRNGSAPTIDFSVERDNASGRMFFAPARPEVTVALYGNAPVADLTSIDFAPDPHSVFYGQSQLEALPGWGYVFQIGGFADGFARYGAVRPTHVGQTFLILDWSYQTDPGDPELRLGRTGG